MYSTTIAIFFNISCFSCNITPTGAIDADYIGRAKGTHGGYFARWMGGKLAKFRVAAKSVFRIAAKSGIPLAEGSRSLYALCSNTYYL